MCRISRERADLLPEMNPPDGSLLQTFVRSCCEDAFATLVSRHIQLVYSAALRQVGERTLAEEVVQSVFTDLARSAPNLGPQASIPSWLFQVTRRTAIDLVRREARRVSREQAVMQFTEDCQPVGSWESIAPILDEAMQLLSEPDRTALLVRFFEDRSLLEVGVALGISEDAAQKRVQRAIDRLRTHLRRYGITTGTGGLAAVMAAHAIAPVPAGLAAVIAVTATSAALISTSTLPFAATLVTMTAFTKVAVALTAAVILFALILQSRRAHALNFENLRLRTEVAPLKTEVAEASAKLQVQETELERLRANQRELLQLRAAAAERLRGGRSAAMSIPAPPPQVADYSRLPAGNPTEALERFMQAAKAGDEEAVARFSAWRRSAQVPDHVLESVRSPNLRNATNSLAQAASMKILEIKSIDPDHQRVRLELVLIGGDAMRREMEFMRENGEWKPAFVVERSPGGSFSVSLFQGLTTALGPIEP